MEIDAVHKSNFYKQFEKALSAKESNNTFYMDDTQYNKFIEEVKEAKKVAKRTSLHYRRLKRFDICTIDGIDQLIAAVTTKDPVIKYYVKNDDLFNILHKIHVSIGHGGRNRMKSEAEKTYKNITQESIMIYLRLCESCQLKLKPTKKGTEMANSKLVRVCQVDLMDMQTNPDGCYKFIFLYQDLSTKFLQLRPLINGTPEEVAKVLMDIFCIFGPSTILQTDVADTVIENLTTMWKGLEIVHIQSSADGTIIENIQDMLKTWMQDNNCQHWSEGLKFVQLMKNRIYQDGIKRTPYEAMFRSDVKLESDINIKMETDVEPNENNDFIEDNSLWKLQYS